MGYGELPPVRRFLECNRHGRLKKPDSPVLISPGQSQLYWQAVREIGFLIGSSHVRVRKRKTSDREIKGLKGEIITPIVFKILPPRGKTETDTQNQLEVEISR